MSVTYATPAPDLDRSLHKLLLSAPRKMADLVDATNAPKSQVYLALKRLQRHGYVQLRGDRSAAEWSAK